jgi:hypothetical protein
MDSDSDGNLRYDRDVLRLLGRLPTRIPTLLQTSTAVLEYGQWPTVSLPEEKFAIDFGKAEQPALGKQRRFGLQPKKTTICERHRVRRVGESYRPKYAYNPTYRTRVVTHIHGLIAMRES